MPDSHWSDSKEISIHPSCSTMTRRAFSLLVILGFCAMWQKADAQITLGKPELSGPSKSSILSVEEFSCKVDNITTDQAILYQLFKEGNLHKSLGDYSALNKEEATFNFIIKLAYDGRLICRASVQNNTEINATFSDWMDFQVVVPVQGAQIISSPSLEHLWEGDSLTLQCNITEGTRVLYDWFLNDVLLHGNSSENQLNISRLSSKHSGEYVCVAKNYLNETKHYFIKSEGRNVYVKEYLSKPEISFEVVKNAEGNFSAKVTCQVSKGSLSITFILFKNSHKFAEVTREQQVSSFVVSIVLDQDMGTVYCQANNGKTPVQSRELNLTVESVGGTVTMTLEKYIGQDFEVLGVWLYCQVGRGRFPQYYWFLNNTRLESQGTFYKTLHPNHSGLFVTLHPRIASGGVYHCEAINSFDNTTKVSSPKTLISHEVFNKIPTPVAATVFTSFVLLICAVLACCVYGVVLRKRQAREYIFRLKDFTERHSIVDEDGVADKREELEVDDYEEGENDDTDTEAYIEDKEVVQASMLEDSNESEEDEEPDSEYYTF